MTLTNSEKKIFNSIKIASENDPNNPEFPPENPKFPATPTYKIEVPGFSNVWLKDESHNPTGTHKDRMAWEIIVTYRDILLAKQKGLIRGGLPHPSIISSGSAALAIQTMLKKYCLPNLKVLVDIKTNNEIKDGLERVGCDVYETDLSRKPFNWKEILALTHNQSGFDITSNTALDLTARFYDWLSYEIINLNPDYCFIPFGTGHLYENVLDTNKKEVSTSHHDPRFKGDVDVLRECNFCGATTNNPNSKAEKLYSPHLPFLHYDEQRINLYKSAGYCGKDSDVYILKEKYLDDAIILAKKNKITAEPSGLAGLALLLQMRDKVSPNAKILIVNTGKAKYVL